VNITVSHTLLKTKFFGLYVCHRLYGSIFNDSYVIGPKAAKFGRIMQNNSHCAVQCHSRSPILVPTESACDFLSRTISKLLQVIGQICAFDTGGTSL